MTRQVVDVKSRDKCQEIKAQLSTKLKDLLVDDLMLVDIYHSRFYALFSDDTSVSKIRYSQ